MADSDSESWGNRDGNSQNEGSQSQRELDRFLPIANVSRIMKKALPANAKISKDAKETVQECVSEFISFITGEASDKCQREKRKTVNGDDLLWAMSTLGFEDYVEPLKIYLQRFRDTEGEKTALAGRESGGSVGGGGGYEGSYGVMGGHQIQGPVYGYGPDAGAGYHVGPGSSAPDARPRIASYSVEEDRILCHTYLDISQTRLLVSDLKDQFWSRIEEAYNLNKLDNLQVRNKRSVQCRMRNILHDISKLTGCVSQIEALRPSGASEEDILNRAKDLLMQDTEFRKRFKFDHVWPIMKDFIKFSSDNNPSKTHETHLDSSQSDMPTPNTPTSGSTGLPSFEINLSSDDTAGGTSSQRPLGVKKSKLKKKRVDNVLELISTMKE